MPEQVPEHLFLIVPSNPTHRKMFHQYEKSFSENKMIGIIFTKDNFVFLISPKNDKVSNFYPNMQKGHLLGIYFTRVRKPLQHLEQGIRASTEADRDPGDRGPAEDSGSSEPFELDLSAFD